MDGDVLRKFDMGVRVRDLLRTRPFGVPNADAVIARFEDRVARAEALIQQIVAGERAARASTSTRAELRDRLTTETLRHLARVAKAAAQEKPEVAAKFKLPRRRSGEREFLGTARAIAAEIAGNKDLFLKHGMLETAVADLDRQLDQYDRAVVDGHAGRAAHTGARAEIRALGKELVAMVKQLEGMLLLKFRADPNLKGAWDSARNVAWPVPAAKEPASGGEGGEGKIA